MRQIGALGDCALVLGIKGWKVRRVGLWLACIAASGCYEGARFGLSGADDAGPAFAGPDEGGTTGPGRDTAGDSEGEEACVHDGVGAQPLRRLTRSQYTNTIRDLVGVETDAANAFPPDERIGSFYSNGVAPVTDLVVEQYMTAAEKVTEAVTDISAILPCDPVAMGETECAHAFIDGFGRRAFRRPLRDVERTQMRDLYATADTFDLGIRLVLRAFLQSPYLLYHIEAGEPAADGELVVPLTSYEVASRLSYFLWDSMPDDALLDAAEAGELATAEDVRAQAERMLDDPRSRAAIASFHLQWLQVDNLENFEKDEVLFPDFDVALAQAMKKETVDFAEHVLREGDGSLDTLLTAPWSVVEDPELAQLYGVEIPPDHVPGEPLDLDPEQRAGVLTHAGFLARFAHTNQSSPVHRGVVIRTNFLCQQLPPVPEDVDNTPPDPDPDATTRERFAEHTTNPACAGCHVLIDGIGFGFEHYDAIGAYRTMEGTLPVDASGEVLGVPDIEDGEFEGAIELAAMLSESEEVRRCMAQQWFNFGMGRVQSDEDECSSDQIYARFEASEWNVRELMLAVVETAAFRYRRLDGGGQ